MKGFKIGFLLIAFSTTLNFTSQSQDNSEHLNDEKKILKLEHAEPLYIDLIRDLGARKGEREWNVGVGLTDKLNHDRYNFLVEYEWAPIDRLGLEIEIPFSFYSRNGKDFLNNKPPNSMESLKTAFQYTFLVSDKWKTSMAFGYINELEFYDFERLKATNLLKGNIFNPFLIVAKRLSENYHTLIYTGPVIEKPFNQGSAHWNYQINTNFHYMLPSSRNFIGVEFNKNITDDYHFEMVIRPQMRVSIADNLLIGIVTGIPISKQNERLSTFLRLIYEPKHKHFKLQPHSRRKDIRPMGFRPAR